ncbi:MAG: hypothetical protein J1E06_02115, partial [Acutalibacter sp.]|nr:hypothetical protein [Acutalibacter sp.]
DDGGLSVVEHGNVPLLYDRFCSFFLKEKVPKRTNAKLCLAPDEVFSMAGKGAEYAGRLEKGGIICIIGGMR